MQASRSDSRILEPRTTYAKVRLSRLASAVAIALALPAVQQASAQDAPAGIDEIVITGSRIVRRDYEANSPIQTIDSSAFEQQSSIAIEDTLNDLPQFVPAATGLTQVQDGELINTGSTTTAGAATLSLRGLGPNRNLVLLDGYRAMPTNATMAVDLNSIPAAAIDRVEVITGGASSVYGADAVAGVVNFILKKNFEGADLDIQYGAMQNGQAGETRASGLFGVNSSNGRGNIMLGIEYANRKAVEWKDVDFYRKAIADPTVPGTVSIMTDPYYNIDGTNAPNGAAIDTIFNQVQPGVVLRDNTGAVNGRVYWNADSTIYTGGAIFNGVAPAGPGGTAGNYRYDGPLTQGDFGFRKIDSDGQIEEFIPHHKANVPLERYSVFARANYNLTDDLEASVQASSVEQSVFQLWQVSPATGGWSQTIPHGTGVYAPSVSSLGADGLPNTGDTGENMTTLAAYQAGGQFGLACAAVGGCTNSQAFPVSPELGALLDSRPNPNATWNLSYSLNFPYYGLGLPRSIQSDNRTNQVSFGLKGKIAAIDGTWDFIASHGTTTLGLKLQGYAALSRVRAVMQSPNFGHGFFQQANAGPPGNGFAGGVASCTSGLPVFRPHDQVSQDCLDSIIVELQHQSDMQQNFVEANVQGKVADLWAGEARFSAGLHSRDNSYEYVFDTLNTQSSFLDLGLGTFPANNTKGDTSVNEIYGELLLPMAKGHKGAEHLNLELGYRYSDYKYQGGIDTYKALVDWGITDTLRFRGGRQVATRAPNIAEMFQAQSQTWSAIPLGDPCGLNTIAPYGANPATNPAHAAQARQLCAQIMGSSGASVFYDPGTIQPSGNFGLWFVNAVGNPQVNPEEATTYTAGFVWQPRTGKPLRDGFSGTIDYYKIDISHMIAVEPGPAVYEQCLSATNNPTFDPANAACQRLIRNPANGALTAENVSYINAGNATVSGVDLSANWRVDLADMGITRIPGHFGVNFLLSNLLRLETQATVNSPSIDWKGSLGPDPGTSLNNGAYDYRLFTTVSYGFNDWNMSLRWRHLPKAVSAVDATTTQPVTIMGAESDYDVFDFSAAWDVNEKTTLRMGMDNVFDKAPVITGRRTAGDPNPTSGQGTTEAGFYDILGRQFYLGVQAKF
jgi:outer membrane receptor protein involved in Fe transport